MVVNADDSEPDVWDSVVEGITRLSVKRLC